jgi:hypothetical protein
MIVMGAPAMGTSAIVTPTSHRRQWSRVSFQISSREMQFLSNLTEDQKSKVSSSTPPCLYHRGTQSGCSKPTSGIVRGALGASTSSPSKPCNAPFTVSGGLARTIAMSIQLVWQGSREGEPPLREECVASVHQRSDPNKLATRHDSTRGTKIR